MGIDSTIFEFSSYKFEPEKKRIFFNYKIVFNKNNSISFTEIITLPKIPNLKNVPKELYESIFADLHLALGISYYKLHCSRKIKINYSLTNGQADFWNSFYINGLGEFFYRNKLNPAIFPRFSFDKNKEAKSFRLQPTSKFLVGIGGGKDSIVSAELFKKHKLDFSSFYIETQRPSLFVNNLIKKIGGDSLKIKRQLDSKIFENRSGWYAGHIPISGIYAFLGILSGIFYNYSYFVVSNEFSSNFGNVKYKGRTINHQWSKSLEFEKMFQDYVYKFISPDLLYFSLLRPFYEIRIAKMFSGLEKYFLSFSSCNNNFKIDNINEKRWLWCGCCPKCVFVFLILAPFVSKSKLVKIFNKNLFADEKILDLLGDILGFGKIKPFDCVGTFYEAQVALYMCKDKFKNDIAIKTFLPKINSKEITDKVFKTQESLAPAHLKFLGLDNVLILGYGKEGRVTEEFLKKNFNNLRIGKADAKDDKKYLEKQKEYDIIVRSPGVAKEKIDGLYTTATNIFFSIVRQVSGVKIIGVTGTKGKSTTASLIYHILKKSGKNVELLGNIGKPMLSAVRGKIKKNAIFILELSSYQLDDIKFSPDIAVVTSLFSDHIDYHGSLENYYNAKKNIIKYQQAGDVFIFNHKNKEFDNWKEDLKSKAVSIIPEKFLKGVEISLIGSHNRNNVRAAIAVAKELNIKDNKIKKAVESFKSLSHRLEYIGEFKGIKFYDDAISTTPESTIEAIKALSKIGTIFLGGQDRGYKFSNLERRIKKEKIKNIVLFPETGNKILKSKKELNVLETKSMKEAVEFAFKYTQEGEICLLSCASPSYSLWNDYEEKGNQFKILVKNISKK